MAVLLAGVLPAWEAYAQPAPPPGDVDVTLVGGGDVDSLVDTIRELVGRLGLTLTPHVANTATDVVPAPSARVIVEIDFTAPGEIVLTVRSDAAHAAGRRRIARDGSASVVREEVADAVSSMVEAQLMSSEAPDAGPAPSETAEPPPPPPPPPPVREQVPEAPPARPAPRTFAIDLTTFAGVGPFAGNVSVVGRLGGGIVLASRRGLRPSLALTGEGFLPFDTSNDGVTAQTTIESVRAVAAIEILRSSSWLAVDVGAGFGFDLVSVDPTTVPAGAQPSPRTKGYAMASASIAANLALTPGVVLTLTALGDVDLASRRSYVVQNDTGLGPPQDLLFAPWPVRPAALLGFTFTTFGDGRFASREPR
jgi:hypothetical protein